MIFIISISIVVVRISILLVDRSHGRIIHFYVIIINNGCVQNRCSSRHALVIVVAIAVMMVHLGFLLLGLLLAPSLGEEPALAERPLNPIKAVAAEAACESDRSAGGGGGS